MKGLSLLAFRRGKIRSAEWQAYMRSTEWDARRRRVFKRDGWRCTMCPSRRNLQGHHAVYPKNLDWRIDRDEHVSTLCRRCHRDYHKRIDFLSWMRWSARSAVVLIAVTIYALFTG